MQRISYTLLTDGSSDKCLLPIINWCISQALPNQEYLLEPQWADLRNLPNPPRDLTERIKQSVRIFPCDILIIHRDAENQSFTQRQNEINAAVQVSRINVPYVCIIPIRMQEAWLLIDSTAIRYASGNPNGLVNLNMPRLSQIENLPDPKSVLYSTLKQASDLSGRKLEKFNYRKAAYFVSENISNYTDLRQLPAFERFENELSEKVNRVIR